MSSMSRAVPLDLIKADGALNQELFNKAKEYCNALSFVRSPVTKVYMKVVLLQLALVKERLAKDSALTPEEMTRINELFRKALGNIKVEAVNNHGEIGFKAVTKGGDEKATKASVERAAASAEADAAEMQSLVGLQKALDSHAQHSKASIKQKVTAGTVLTPAQINDQQKAMRAFGPVAEQMAKQMGAELKTERRSSSSDLNMDLILAEIHETAAEMIANATEVAETHNSNAEKDKIGMNSLISASSSLFGLAARTVVGNARKSIVEGAKSVFGGESAKAKKEREALDAVKEMIASNKNVASQRHKEKLAEITDEQRELGYHVGVRSAGLSWENFEDLVVKQRRDGPKVVAAFMAEAKAQGGVVKDMDAALEKVKKAAPASPPPRPGRNRGDSNLL